MENILQNIDWMSLIGTVWTIVFVPIGKAIYDWLKSKRLDKYGKILYEEVLNAVKSVQNAVVDDVKGTEGWNDEAKEYVRELAKTKVRQALSNSVLKSLQQANADFEFYLDSLVDSALFDIKKQVSEAYMNE